MLSRLVQIAVLALGLTIGSQANAAPLAYGTYYDEKVNIDCSGSPACRVHFEQLPADKLLMVQKIHCTVISFQPMIQGFLLISATLGGANLQRWIPLSLPPAQLISGSYYTNFREDTQFLIGSGRFPFIHLFAATTNSFDGSCTIIGELVNPI
jgi:hypothetical protein